MRLALFEYDWSVPITASELKKKISYKRKKVRVNKLIFSKKKRAI